MAVHRLPLSIGIFLPCFVPHDETAIGLSTPLHAQSLGDAAAAAAAARAAKCEAAPGTCEAVPERRVLTNKDLGAGASSGDAGNPGDPDGSITRFLKWEKAPPPSETWGEDDLVYAKRAMDNAGVESNMASGQIEAYKAAGLERMSVKEALFYRQMVQLQERAASLIKVYGQQIITAPASDRCGEPGEEAIVVALSSPKPHQPAKYVSRDRCLDLRRPPQPDRACQSKGNIE
jgi:hypothetical protein